MNLSSERLQEATCVRRIGHGIKTLYDCY